MIEQLKQIDNYTFLNNLSKNSYNAEMINKMSQALKLHILENSDKSHEAHNNINLIEKLILISESTSALETAILSFIEIYTTQLDGMTAGKPTKIVGFLQNRYNDYSSFKQGTKKDAYDGSTVIISLIFAILALLAILSLYFFAPISNLFTAEALYGISVFIGAIAFIIGIFIVGPIISFIAVAIFGFVFVKLNNLLPLGFILKIILTGLLALVILGCLSVIKEELDKKKNTNSSKKHLDELRIESRKTLITTYIDSILKQLHHYKNYLNTSDATAYYNEFAQKLDGISGKELLTECREKTNQMIQYYRYVLNRVNGI